MKIKNQNACLMITCADNENDDLELLYIPLNVNPKTLKLCLKRGKCDNKNAISFTLEETKEEFWSNMWEELMQN